MKKNISLLTILLFSFSIVTVSQVYSDKVVGKNKQAEIDSLKTNEWPHLLPIGGKKVTSLGFDLPKPIGFSMQYITQESDIVIDNLMVGFNGGQMYDLGEVVRFTNTKAITNGINVRPDFWVFPFLNVYGIFARSQNQTEVAFDIYAPGEFAIGRNGLQWDWVKVTDMSTTAKFEATSYGFGMTPTVGVGGGFFALDMNWTWTDIPELDKPASAFVFGPRLGKSFKFKRQDQALAVWVGAFRINLGSETSGSLLIDDLFPNWDDQINTGLDGIYDRRVSLEESRIEVDNAKLEADEWWDGLGPLEKKDSDNISQRAEDVSTYASSTVAINAADAVLDKAGNVLNAASNGESVEYSLEKRQENMWNFIVGSQFQLNKNWMIRGELGFLGSRTQFIGGLQYRFGL